MPDEKIPIWIRYHGINIGLIALFVLGISCDYLGIEDDTAYFFSICGFIAGSLYTQLHNDEKKRESDKITAQLWVNLQNENKKKET